VNSSEGLRVIDDYLPDREFLELKRIIMETEFPLYFSKSTTISEYDITEDLKSKYEDLKTAYPYPEGEGLGLRSFHHFFFLQNYIDSPYKEIIFPILDRLDTLALIRAKLNFTPPTSEPRLSGWHYDIDHLMKDGSLKDLQQARVAIFCITSNNGHTLLEDGTRIESKANRIIIFPANILHTGVSHTDTEGSMRVNININYIPNTHLKETNERT
jgi:hypothetical protein